MNKKRLDKASIISLGAMALLFAVGILFFFLFVFHINIAENMAEIIGSYSGLSGSIWLVLLCRNC